MDSLNHSDIVIDLGSLKGHGNFYHQIAPQFKLLRTILDNSSGSSPNVSWDIQKIEAGKASITGITTFLSMAFSISRHLKKPTSLILGHDRKLFRFLEDIHFFKIAKEQEIFTWDERLVGDLPPSKNPKAKILCFDDVPDSVDYSDDVFVAVLKESKREQVSSKLNSHFSNFLYVSPFESEGEWNAKSLRQTVVIAGAELVINSLIHARSTCFLGIQITDNGLSVCVSDSGLGFLRSMRNSQNWLKRVGLETVQDAILNASLMKSNEIGLLHAIVSVIHLGGWTTISSDNCEFRWEKLNFNKAYRVFNRDKFKEDLQSALDILGPPSSGYIDPDSYRDGYYKLHKNKIRGSRITFEIPNISK